ncbi:MULTISPECIES: LysR family transcriptional regulator [unclassified Vibrio]|uniref:LysR family transcriptional regulator n=1 Tax=unclassified Vibrio TaxID=2614977 RepID=UPI00354AE0A4
MFTKDQIVSFCAVFDKGSFSAGARFLNRDRTTVREHISVMEDNMRLPLFEMKGRSTLPTLAAKKLYPRAKIIVRQIEEFELTALNSFNNDLLIININHDTTIPISLIHHINSAISKDFPNIQLNWLHRGRKETIDELISGQAHLALMTIKMLVQPENEVNYINLGRIQHKVYAGAKSHLANRMVKISDLKLEKQFIYEHYFNASIQGSNISPQYQLVSTKDVLIELLEKDGWAVLPTEHVEKHYSKDSIVELDVFELVNSLDYHIGIFFSPSLEQHDVISNIMTKIRNYAEKEYN